VGFQVTSVFECKEEEADQQNEEEGEEEGEDVLSADPQQQEQPAVITPAFIDWSADMQPLTLQVSLVR
jgi:hypothetical protein